MKKLFVFPFVLMVIFSCKSDPPEPPCTTTATSVSGSYKITAYRYKATPASTEVDYFAIIMPDACERDDIYTFNANGTYSRTDGGAVCIPSGNGLGTWALSGNIMTVDGDQTIVESFDCKTLILVNTDTHIAGDILKFTLAKQ